MHWLGTLPIHVVFSSSPLGHRSTAKSYRTTDALTSYQSFLSVPIISCQGSGAFTVLYSLTYVAYKCRTFANTTPTPTLSIMSQQQPNKISSNESDIRPAFQAILKDATLPVRRTAAIYNVSEMTLQRRRDGILSRRDCVASNMLLAVNEEKVLVNHILEFAVRGYPPRLRDVEDIANSLLEARHRGLVGGHRARDFVKCRPELQIKFN